MNLDDLQALLELAARSPKSIAEQLFVARLAAWLAEQMKAQKEATTAGGAATPATA